jgi:hypothetical protein
MAARNGRLGVTTGSPDLDELLDLTDPNRVATVELRPVVEVADWSLHSGTTYVSVHDFVFDDVVRDVISVKTADEVLSRADTLADCIATVGTFFYDVDEVFDAPVINWDDGSFWDAPAWESAVFNGTNTQYEIASLSGAFDSSVATFSTWVKFNGGDGTTQQIFAHNVSGSGRINVLRDNDDNIRVIAKDSSNNTMFTITSSVTVTADGDWHHVMVGFDTSATTYVAVDGVVVGSSTASPANDIDLTGGEYEIGQLAGTQQLNGELANLWFHPVLHNPNDSTELAKFFSGSTPKNLGEDGSLADGVQPLIFFVNGDFTSNRGSSGDFTSAGTTATGTGPGTVINCWDQVRQLYVNLSDGSDPSDTTVAAVVPFHFASKALILPDLSGNNLVTNGDFENWTGGSPDNFTKTGTGTVDEETTDVKINSSAARLTAADTTVGGQTILTTGNITLVSGHRYRLHGYYKTIGTNATQGVIRVRDNFATPNAFVHTDGTNWEDVASFDGDIDLNNTGDAWKRFIVDFRAESSGNHVVTFETKSGGSGTSIVLYDGIVMERIYRYYPYDPRVSNSSIPSLETGSPDIYFAGKQIGSGDVSLINSDGFIERLVAELQWMSQSVIVKIGGAIEASDGTTVELDVNQYFAQMTGLIQRINITDDIATFDLDDERTFFHQQIATDLYSEDDLPNLSLTKTDGRIKPVFFGVKSNITPFRVNVTANDYGVYEVADVSRAPNGIKEITTVYAYTSEEFAGLRLTTERLELVDGTDYTTDVDNGRFTISRDVGPYRVLDTNSRLDFNEGGAELTAELTSGLYTAQSLAAHVQTQLRDAGAADWNCAYSNTTHQITVSKDAGTANLLTKTGSHSSSTGWGLLGFNLGDDNTGSLSYEADNAIFDDVDRDHILRTDAKGYRDDASGTFTGTADALIEIGADILQTLLVRFMGKPSSAIDTTSFLFARDTAAESLSIYLRESTSTSEIFDTLERSNLGNIIIDGSGKIFYQIYVGTVADNITTVFDYDISDFSSSRASNEVFAKIRVDFDQDPSRGTFESVERSDTSVSVLLGRPDIKPVETYLKITDNAESLASRILELSSSAARKIQGTVIGGKLMRKEVGDKFKILKRRGLGKSGQISNEIFRIISLSKDALSGLVQFTATDDRVTVASQACVNECQGFCQSSCQSTCQQSCQDTCEIACQETCEASCQIACQSACQDTCQLACQSTCELTCQDTCQSSCQATCELACQGGCEGGGCQTPCESSCQTACELGCQSPCESSCQTVCQQGCQSGCQITCQTGCQVTCQSTCEVSCQSNCELNCQSTCELNCQVGCQTHCQSQCQSICQSGRESGDEDL